MPPSGVPPESTGESAKDAPRGAGTLRNVFSNWGAFLFHALTGFFVSPFVVNTLGNDVYGTWALLASLVGYLGLLDLGVRGAVTRFVSNLHAAGEHGEAERYSSAALVVFTVTSVIALAAGVAVALVIDAFSIPPDLIRDAKIAVMLSAGTIAVAFITGVYGGIITAMQRFDLSSGTDVVVEGIRIVVLVVALKAGYGLVALPAIQLGASLLRLAISIFFSRRLYPEITPSYRGWTREQVVSIFDFSLTSTGLNGAGIIIMQMDAVVIGWFLPVAQVTFFAIAGNLTRYARSTVTAISHTMTPRASALSGAGADSELERLPLLGSRAATLILLPIAVTFLLRGETFIGLWMGAEYALPSGGVLLILTLPLVFDAGRSVTAATIMGLDRHKALLLPYAGEAVANFVLSVVLVRSIGIEGVAWGTAIPRLVTTGLILPRIYSRILGFTPGRFWIEAWVRPALAMIPFAAATWAVEELLVADSLLIFFMQVALVLPAAAAGAWLWGMDGQERSAIRRRLAEKLFERD